jgi:GR25 family glycosyltransferase involved in LPS biosynthesis
MSPSLDRIFVINLARRRDRLRRMRERLLAAGLGPPVEFFRAVDAGEISAPYLEAHSVSLFPGWKDPTSSVPYHARDLKLGEIGCALSHHLVWQRIADLDLGAALILEDDVALAPDAAAVLAEQLAILGERAPDWDLCYLGRKRVVVPPFMDPPAQPEPVAFGRLVRPGFSYQTHAYALSRSGARKLLAAGLDRNLIPADEFIPAMYARHPRADVRAIFGDGDRLQAFAIEPGVAAQSGEGSDTEASAFAPHGPAGSAPFGLAILLHAKTPARFLSRRWPRAIHVAHGPLRRLPIPPALMDLDAVVRARDVRLSLFGKKGLRATIASAKDAMSFYRHGGTLYIAGLEVAFPALKDMCSALARDLEVDPAHVYVEAFASPPGAGASMHYDFDVNFNVQLKGSKVWRVAQNRDVENPMQSLHIRRGAPNISPFDGRRLPSAMPAGSRTIDARPGSVVFLPRGTWHETETRAESFAIAFVIKPPAFFQLFVRELSNRLLLEPEWRAYPLGADRRERFERALQTLPRIAGEIGPDEVLFNVVRVRWAEGTTRALTRSRARRHGEHWALSVRSDGADVEYPVAEAMAPLVRWMVDSAGVFSTEDAVAACPGTSPALARSVVSYLIHTGALVRA